LHLDDDGPAFDPTIDRDFDGPNRDRGGGVGLELVRNWAREFSYRREDGRNRVTLTL
jgi:anti-sigma regulatory factor (Ser/Thr protein kinase)